MSDRIKKLIEVNKTRFFPKKDEKEKGDSHISDFVASPKKIGITSGITSGLFGGYLGFSGYLPKNRAEFKTPAHLRKGLLAGGLLGAGLGSLVGMTASHHQQAQNNLIEAYHKKHPSKSRLSFTENTFPSKLDKRMLDGLKKKAVDAHGFDDAHFHILKKMYETNPEKYTKLMKNEDSSGVAHGKFGIEKTNSMHEKIHMAVHGTKPEKPIILPKAYTSQSHSKSWDAWEKEHEENIKRRSAADNIFAEKRWKNTRKQTAMGSAIFAAPILISALANHFHTKKIKKHFKENHMKFKFA